MKMIYAHKAMKRILASLVSLVFATSLIAQESESLFELPPLEVDDVTVETVPNNSVAVDTATLEAVGSLEIIEDSSAIASADTVATDSAVVATVGSADTIAIDSAAVSTAIEKVDTAAQTTQRMYNDTVIEKIQISSTPIEEPVATEPENVSGATKGAAMPQVLQRVEAEPAKLTISKIASEVPQDSTALEAKRPLIKVVTTEDMAAQGQQPPLDADIAAKEAERKVAEAAAPVATKEKQTASAATTKKVVTTTTSSKTKTQVLSTSSTSTSSSSSSAKKTTATPGQVYRIQVLALQNESQQKLNEIKKQVGAKVPVSVIEENGMKKYVVGSFKTYNEAAQFRDALMEKGFKGCFVVAYNNGKRVAL